MTRGVAAFCLLAVAFFAAREVYFSLLPVQPVTVEDVGETTAARDLGILQTVERGRVLTGSDINNIKEDTRLSSVLKGALDLVTGPELRVTTRTGLTADVDLEGAGTFGDVIRAISEQTPIEASISEGGDGLVLSDPEKGEGTLKVEAAGGSKAAEQLGLGVNSTGDKLVGKRLVGDILTLRLDQVNGGTGVDRGTVKIMDKRGRSMDLDLSESVFKTVGDVIDAINSSREIKVRASVSAGRDAIILQDESGFPFMLLGKQFSIAHVVAAAILIGSTVGVYVVVNRPRVADFLVEVEGELRKVSWPTRREVIGSTVVVLILVTALTVYIFVADSLLVVIMKGLF